MLCWISFIKTPEQSVINTVTVLCGQEAGACCWDVKHSIPTNATGRAPLPCILLIPGPTATLLLSLSGNEMYFYTEGIYSARYISVSQPCSSNCIWDENTVSSKAGCRRDRSRHGLFARAEGFSSAATLHEIGSIPTRMKEWNTSVELGTCPQ